MTNLLLTIEHDNETRTNLKDSLTDSRFYFPETDPAYIVEEVSRCSPDLILLDIDMPESKSMEYVARLRTNPIVRDIPLILMSRLGKPHTFFNYPGEIIKTTDVDEIRSRIEYELMRSRMEKSVREAMGAIGSSKSASQNQPAIGLTKNEFDILKSGGFDVEVPSDFKPLAEYAARYQALLNSSLSVSEAAKRLDVSPSRVRQRLLSKPRDLFGIRLDNAWKLPIFQFIESGLIPHFGDVIAKIDPKLDSVAVERWFNSDNVDLVFDEQNVSPRDWLLMGKDWRLLAELAMHL